MNKEHAYVKNGNITKENISLRMKRIPHYIEVYTGIAPQQRDLDRFFARHSFKGADLG